MNQYISKSALVAEIEKNLNSCKTYSTEYVNGKKYALKSLLSFLDTLEVIDPYEQCVQYDSIKAGIQAQAETYSFNIESELFNQLTTEDGIRDRKSTRLKNNKDCGEKRLNKHILMEVKLVLNLQETLVIKKTLK